MTPMPRMQARENALAVLRRLASSAAGQAPLAAAGMIPVFVSKVQSGSDAQKTTSAGALRDLAVRKENHAAIACAGGIEALVGLAKDGNAVQQEVAIAALLALAENEANSVHPGRWR
jgi:vacuolar protein 8